MKSINKFALLFAAAAGTMVSCSNEEALLKGSDNSGETVHMVVTAIRESEDVTRTSLTDSKAHLYCKWDEGDHILVTSKTGIIKGKLKLKDGDGGKTKGTFEGDLEGIVASPDGTVKLNYYYLGTGNKKYEGMVDRLYSHDFSTQKGTLASLTEYDIMSVEKTAVIKGGNSYVEEIDLARRVSFARFKMNLPSTAKYPVTVNLSGSQLGNAAEISLVNPEEVKYTKGNVVVNTNSNDFYITYLPTDGKYDITFVAVDANDVTYTGIYKVKQTIGQNKYLRKSIKNDNDEVIDGEGVEVDMTAVENEYEVKYVTDNDQTLIEGFKPTSTGDIEWNVKNNGPADIAGIEKLYAPEGMEFDKWKDLKAGNCPEKVTLSKGTPSFTFVPTWKDKTTVNVTWNDGYSEDPIKTEGVKVGENEKKNIGDLFPDDPTHDGYIFDGWEIGGKPVDKTEVTVTKADAENGVVITARWKVYTIKTPGYGHGEFNTNKKG